MCLSLPTFKRGVHLGYGEAGLGEVTKGRQEAEQVGDLILNSVNSYLNEWRNVSKFARVERRKS